MDNKKRLALIDLDTFIFVVAYVQYKNGNMDNPEQVKNHIKEFINVVLVNIKADFVSMVYQAEGHENYRKYFYPDYKENRPEAPVFLDIWKNTIIESFEEMNAVGVKVIESDDVLSIGYYRYKDEYDIILVHSDKDINQVPGEHYNPTKHITYFIPEQVAKESLLIQTICGDDGDSIQGIYGMACKWDYDLHQFRAPKARKILNTPTWLLDKAIHTVYQKMYDVLTNPYRWYPAYSKCKFLVTLLKEIDYTAYPFSEEVQELFNIVPVKLQTASNLFE